MGNTCSYDCSKRPLAVSPYPDISGIGVVVGYVATAGIVIAIITLFFLAAYVPTDDPFQDTRSTEHEPQAREARPNPVDVVFLGYIRRWPYPARLKDACLQCVLAMSDLQIITGISIMLCGFIQLCSDLSAYHWQVLVNLAWFSSLTHLSCLTFLRNYLYNRPAQRAWRLIAMAAFLIMLLAAFVPTGHYNWTFIQDYYDGLTFTGNFSAAPRPLPSDLAICYFYGSSYSSTGMYRFESDPAYIVFDSMILSVLLPSLAFVVRIVKLHKYLSVDIAGSVGRTASAWSRKCLAAVQNKFVFERSRNPILHRITFRLLYRPLLAAFLTLRLCVDTWSSMTIEIWWLVAAFSWGVENLKASLQHLDGEHSDWSFGQILPVVLLAAPLLTVFEYLYPDGSKPEVDQTVARQINPARQLQILPMPALGQSFGDHPDQDFDAQSPWFKDFVIFILLDILISTIIILSMTGIGSLRLIYMVIPSVYKVRHWLPFYQFAALHVYALFSLLARDLSPHESTESKYSRRQRIAKGCRYALVFFLLGCICSGAYNDFMLDAVYGLYGLYTICALSIP